MTLDLGHLPSESFGEALFFKFAALRFFSYGRALAVPCYEISVTAFLCVYAMPFV